MGRGQLGIYKGQPIHKDHDDLLARRSVVQLFERVIAHRSRSLVAQMQGFAPRRSACDWQVRRTWPGTAVFMVELLRVPDAGERLAPAVIFADGPSPRRRAMEHAIISSGVHRRGWWALARR